ncbi:NUDIX hydrolase [Streptomyces albus]|uniref:NUDIX hydrolase n=1 Tax=Streptomyces albus (strain ATCC 21838 / DSM 41398 / FERM P-419 / JCM 4703 / NBRC 107858) TaxID=1081613 RepID=A0A0B5F9J1_STRA4|nr:NUDIX hydrolase [Streptomyces albus]AOU81810.1 NUDIX hydrolase [Streptomyces albus]AYN37498.1 NUDIX hydrolase [Streptomyces albus]
MTEEQTAKQEKIAAAVVVRDNRVLMVRRQVSEGQLSWQFPAGKIEPGETAEKAAVREAAEETGLTVSVLKSLGSRVHPKTGRNMSYIACSVVSGTAFVADVEELAELAWVASEEIAQYVPYGLYEPVQIYLNEVLR